MDIFAHKDFDHHETVVFSEDKHSGLKAIIAIHNTSLGPALGGCRMWPYQREADALADALRLSRSMSFKSACANLKLGGGKSVIIGDPARHKNEDLLLAMGRFVDQLKGRYIVAEDAGINVQDVGIMARETSHAAGFESDVGPQSIGGDPSPYTAMGVMLGIREAVCHRLGGPGKNHIATSLGGLKVALQGLGNVGYRVASMLREAGAELWVSDLDQARVARAVTELDAIAVGAQEITRLPVDLFVPCALGSVIEPQIIDDLRATVVAGSANNQLAQDSLGLALQRRGILYAPDYVINAGGIIAVHFQSQGRDRDEAEAHIRKTVSNTLDEIFRVAEQRRCGTNTVADEVARQRFEQTRCAA